MLYYTKSRNYVLAEEKLVLSPGFSQDMLITLLVRLHAQKEVADTKLMVFLELSCLGCLNWELVYPGQSSVSVFGLGFRGYILCSCVLRVYFLVLLSFEKREEQMYVGLSAREDPKGIGRMER